jgi:hypothetical protein
MPSAAPTHTTIDQATADRTTPRRPRVFEPFGRFFFARKRRCIVVEFPAFIGFRVRPEERQALEVLAQRDQRSLSETIRQLILREACRDMVEPKECSGETRQ